MQPSEVTDNGCVHVCGELGMLLIRLFRERSSPDSTDSSSWRPQLRRQQTLKRLVRLELLLSTPVKIPIYSRLSSELPGKSTKRSKQERLT